MRKSEQVCARVTPEVMTNLRMLADRQSMLLSEFIRRTLAEKVSRLAADAANDCAAVVLHRSRAALVTVQDEATR